MKVAVLVSYWKNTQGTGVTRYVINLVEEFQKNSGLEISVIYRYGYDPQNHMIDGIKYAFPFRAILLLYQLRPDVIYVDANWYFLLTGIIIKKVSGAKLIATVHSHPSKIPYVGKILMQYLFNSCDVITYVSKNLKDKTRQIWSIPIKVREEITYAGVRSYSANDREIKEFVKKYNVPNNSFVLLMQSSPIAKVKSDGTKILFKAIKKLMENDQNIVVIITGNGPYLNELEEFVRFEGISRSVIFTGWIDNPFIPLALCDIYTHISMGEGLPLALLEAMSIGKPIIATPVGGIPEVIDDERNGLLVEANANVIAGAINRLLKDEILRAKLGQNAFLDSKKYTWEKCANKFIEIFERGGYSKW